MRVWFTKAPVVAAGLLLAIGLVLNLPSAAASLLANVALARVVAAPACDVAWHVCAHMSRFAWYPPQAYAGNQETLGWSLDALQQAGAIDPADRWARLHEAEILFAQGERAQAAAILSEAGWHLEAEIDSTLSGRATPAGSPLVTPGRYEYYLMRGQQQAAQGHWPEAAQAFRLGLAYAGERAIERDRLDFYAANARQLAETAATKPETAWLAGKYYALASEWQPAVNALQPAMIETSGLPGVQRAWAAYYMGQALEGAGDPQLAIEAYRAGWRASQEVRPNGIRLAASLAAGDQAQESGVRDSLLTAGPAVRSGRFAAGYELPTSATLPSGLVFVGYDIDPESIESSSALEVWLWWRKPAGTEAQVWQGADTFDLGEFVIQRQTVANLIPNNAFEWGELPDGTPEGWPSRVYVSAPDSAYVTTTVRDGQETRVAVASNEHYESTGLEGWPTPMETDGWYLMAGWMNDTGNGNLGRNCRGEQFDPGGPYYIAYADQAPIRPAGVWVHIADLAPAFPDHQAEVCQMILTNSQAPGGVTLWDDLILARITLP